MGNDNHKSYEEEAYGSGMDITYRLNNAYVCER